MEGQDWNVAGELYRQKIEALRGEVGSGYLTMLERDGWASSRQAALAADFSPVSTMLSSPTTPRTPSTPAIHSGRTLG
jgi:hypothetical protein